MIHYQIAAIVGRLRSDSFKRKLDKAIEKLVPPEFSFQQVQIGDMPLYNQGDDANPLESIRRLKRKLSAAQGFLVVTTEYNRSIAAELKNAIEHASRPYRQSAWAGKPDGILGFSAGAIRTARAQQNLCNAAAYLDVPTLDPPEAFIQAKEDSFDKAGNLGAGRKKSCRGGWTVMLLRG